MTKTYNEKEFDEMLTSVLTNLVDHAKDRGCSNAAACIMLAGILISSEINHTIFDDDTETITIEKE